MAFFEAKMGWERPKKREKKNYRSNQFLPYQEQKIKKKIAKKFKKLKNIIMASFEVKIGEERPRKRERKNYRSDQFQPNQEQKITKKQQKNSKN